MNIKDYSIKTKKLSRHVFPFVIAKLRDQGGDKTKKWYIEYLAFNFYTCKKRHKRKSDVYNYKSIPA